MEYQRSERVADLLLQVVAELLTREVHDPRLKWLNLTGARLSHDLRRATIYFNLLKAGANEAEAVAGLRSAGGFIRAPDLRRPGLAKGSIGAAKSGKILRIWEPQRWNPGGSPSRTIPGKFRGAPET